MKAISIKQPFASLIRDGKKQYEFRSWNTSYRGDILICSGKKPHWRCDDTDLYPIGCSICIVTITGVLKTKHIPPQDIIVRNLSTGESMDPIIEGFDYAWRLQNPRPVANIPVTGRLGLFTVPDKFKTSC